MKIARERINLNIQINIRFTSVNLLIKIVNYMWLASYNKYLRFNSDRLK